MSLRSFRCPALLFLGSACYHPGAWAATLPTTLPTATALIDWGNMGYSGTIPTEVSMTMWDIDCVTVTTTTCTTTAAAAATTAINPPTTASLDI